MIVLLILMLLTTMPVYAQENATHEQICRYQASIARLAYSMRFILGYTKDEAIKTIEKDTKRIFKKNGISKDITDVILEVANATVEAVYKNTPPPRDDVPLDKQTVKFYNAVYKKCMQRLNKGVKP